MEWFLLGCSLVLLIVVGFLGWQWMDIRRRLEGCQTRHDELLLLWQNNPELLVLMDKHGRIERCNQQPLRSLRSNADHDADLVIGNLFSDLLPEESQLDFRAAFRSATDQRLPASFSISLSAPVRRFLVTVRPLSVESGPLQPEPQACDPRILIVVQDVTESHRNEQQLINDKLRAERASLAKSRFLANMSHEIRTPMTGLLGMVSLMEQTTLSEEQANFLRVIQSSSDHLLSIVNDILDISKIEAGKLTLEEEAFDLSNMVETLLDMVGSKAQEKKLVMQSFIDDDTPPLMVGDSIRLRQILMNFLTNAIKFTEKGHVLLRVVVVRHLSSAVHLRFSVEDSGIGIRADRAMGLFDEYVLGHDQLSTAAGGTGLGLSICKRLAELMGGQVGVVSTPGIGSNFWFDITLSVATCDAPEPVTEFAAKGQSLWICDDLQVNRTLLISIARKLGMTTREFGSSDEMMPLLVRESPSLIVISRNIWEASDGEFQTYLKNHPTRVAMSSPDVLTHDGEELVEQGIHAYWDWPISQTNLSDLLARLLQQDPTSQHLVTRFSRAPASPKRSMTARQSVPELAGAKVLLSEDNPVNQRVASQMLSRLGCVVTVANNGQEAVNLVREQRFDLVLMDCHMPVLDGLDASRAIRAWEAENQKVPVPIVALSADVMSDRKVECEEAGMDGYLSKPIRLNELKRELPAFIGIHDPHEQAET